MTEVPSLSTSGAAPIPPQPFAAEALLPALAAHWGIEGGTFARLASERDDTFHLRQPRLALAGGLADAWPAGLTIKLAHPDEDREALAIQTALLECLAGAAVPQVVRTLAGQAQVEWPGTGAAPGGGRVLRVLTWLEGEQLCRVALGAATAGALGRALGGLDLAMARYAGPLPAGPMLWDIAHILAHAHLAEGVDARWRGLVAQALNECAAHVAPHAGALPCQIIHNDANPWNVLVDPAAPGFVTGFIDFGDVVAAPRVNELAVAAAYHIDRDDWRAVAGAMVAGYHAVAPLSAAEQAMLPVLIAARHALTLMVTEWRAGLHPENRAYILRNHPAALGGLRRLLALPLAERQAWARLACGESA